MAETLIQEKTALRTSEERWSTTLSSIGDAVIATDVKGKITFMNAVAQGLTGWTLEEAAAKPVTEIFNIINEQTRTQVENPVTKVLREGMIVGLANHTVLIRKDGSEIPIDDSGAPIRDEVGNTRGVVLIFRDITERKEAEERASHLASFPELNPAPILEVNVSGEITFCNPGALSILNEAGMNGADCQRLLPEDLGDILRNWDKKSESTIYREILLKNKVFAENIHLVPQFNVARVYAFDITERKRAEEVVQTTLQRFYTVFSSMYTAILLVTDEGRVEFANQAFCDYFDLKDSPADLVGLSPSEIIAKIRKAYLYPDEAMARINEIVNMGQPVRGEEVAIRGGRSFLRDFIPINMNGKSFGRLWYHTDITVRRRAEDSLANDLAALTRIHDLSIKRLEAGGLEPLLQGIMDAAVAIVGADKGTLQLVEGDSLRIVAHHGHERPFLDFFASADNVASVCGEATRRGERVVVEDVEASPLFAGTPSLPVLRDAGVRAVQSTPLLRRQGELLGILTTQWGVPYLPDEHDLWRIDLIARQAADIIEHTRAEEELRRSHEELEQRVAERTAAVTRLAAAVESAAESVLITDPTWHGEYANPAFYHLTGYETDEIVGREIRFLRSEKEDASVYDQNRSGPMTGKPHATRYMIRTKDGTAVPVDSLTSPVKDASGAITNFVFIWRDMSEQLKLEDQLRQSHKMEALGTLAGGIAHDFNNMLAVIIGNAELAIDDASPESDGIRHNLDAIFKAGKRGRDLVKQILTFTRKNEQQKKNQHLGPLIEESFKLLRASIPSNIEMKLNLKTKSDSARVNAPQFQQVILNLCTNAAYAMREKGGLLELSLEDEILEDSSDAKPQKYLKLTVSDTGTGIDKEVKKRIFDPFFTTKGHGEGTGMGLAVVHGIVESHEGIITVQSEPGSGSTFTVLIPKARGKAVSESEPEYAPVGGEERILFVDDEDAVVEMTTVMLERLGYKVTSFTDPEVALNAFTETPHDFDLVITDQTMPQVTGVVLSQKMKTIRSDIPVLLCTGYSHMVSAEQAKAQGIDGYVMKPLDRRELAESIRKVARSGGGDIR